MVLSGKEDKNRASIDVISYFTLGQLTKFLFYENWIVESQIKLTVFL